MAAPTLNEIYAQIFTEWKQSMAERGKQIYPNSVHKCNSLLNAASVGRGRCTIVNVQAVVYDNAENGYHICTRYCKLKEVEPKLHSHVITTVINVYICENSCKVHICDERCTESTIQMPNGEHACSMSGLTRRSQYQDLYTYGDRYCGYTDRKKRARQHKPMQQENKKARKWMNKSGIEETVISTARMKVKLLLFSEQRQKSEQQKMKKLREQAEQESQKYLKQCEKGGHVKCMMHLANRYSRVWERCKTFPIISMTEETANRLTEYYAYFCIAIHRHILMRISQSEENMKTISDFVSCIPAILYLMSRGLKSDDGVQIIHPDKLLDLLLPGPNTLHNYNVHKTSFTHTKNIIIESIQTAISKENVSPASISIKQVPFECIVNSTVPIHMLFQMVNKNTINMMVE